MIKQLCSKRLKLLIISFLGGSGGGGEEFYKDYVQKGMCIVLSDQERLNVF